MGNRDEVAWAAGFFDARGTTTVANRIGRGQRFQNVVLSIKRVDRERLDRFARAIGVGHVYGPYRGQGGRKSWWIYRSTGFEHCQAIIAMMWPWLGAVKRTQAARRLQTYREHKPAAWRVEYRLAGRRLGGARSGPTFPAKQWRRNMGNNDDQKQGRVL